MLKTLAAKLVSGRVVAILITAAVGLGGWAAWATMEMRQCNQSLGGLRATAGQNEQAVVELSRRLSQEVNRRVLSIEQERAANAVLERRLAEIQRQTNKERQERDAIYQAEPDCDAWRTALVCDALADRLRDRARTLSPDNRRGAGAGASGNP